MTLRLLFALVAFRLVTLTVTADPLKLEPDYAITCKSLYGSCLSIPTLFRLEKAQKISSCDVKPFV